MKATLVALAAVLLAAVPAPPAQAHYYNDAYVAVGTDEAGRPWWVLMWVTSDGMLWVEVLELRVSPTSWFPVQTGPLVARWGIPLASDETLGAGAEVRLVVTHEGDALRLARLADAPPVRLSQEPASGGGTLRGLDILVHGYMR